MGSRIAATIRVKNKESVEIAAERFLPQGNYPGEVDYADADQSQRKELSRAVIFLSRKRAVDLGLDLENTSSSRVVLDVTHLVRDELVKIV